MRATLVALLLGVPVTWAVALHSALPAVGSLTPAASREIPPELVAVYQGAAKRCAGLPWQVLAAIGWVESRHAGGWADRVTGDVDRPIVGPAQDGRSGSAAIADPRQPDGWAHALGPMQILPAAWDDWSTAAPGQPPGTVPSPQNAWDSIYTTAAELCAGRPLVGDLAVAVLDHHPRRGFLVDVMTKAAEYGFAFRPPAVPVPPPPGSSGGAVVAAAMRVLGVPYVWGSESPADGFDCSGLVWWAYRQVGIAVPRTTAGQILTGVAVTGGDLRPGDLIFRRGGETGEVRDFGHVSLYAGGGREIVAPRTGATVTLAPVDPGRIQAVRRVLAPA